MYTNYILKLLNGYFLNVFQVIRTLSEDDAFLFWKSFSGVRKNTEMVILPSPVGVAVSEYRRVETRVIKIHHSENRTHISPVKKGEIT